MNSLRISTTPQTRKKSLGRSSRGASMQVDSYKLTDLLSAIVDNRGRSCPTSDSGIPLIATNCIKSESLYPRYEKLRFVSQETYETWFRGHPLPGDLIFVCKGSPGRVCLAPDPVEFCIAQDMVALRPDPAKVYDKYLLAALRSPEVQRRIANLHVGSLIPHFKKGDFGKLLIPVPDRGSQVQIGDLYYHLSRKISINENIAATADSLISALHLNAAAEVPAEFSEKALTAAADFINGRAFTKEATGVGRMVVRISEINSGPGLSTVYNEVEVPEKHLARPGDFLFAWSGSLTAARWYRPEAIINQHIFKVVPKGDRPMWLVAELVRMKLAQFRAIAADKATTMGHIQRRHLEEPVLMPSIAMTQKLDSKLRPLWDRALAAEQESLALTALRDTLLPQLMSGKLRVRDAERIVEDAV
ncbi:restriction endonuclease subunit S [Streptomyces sp. NPDC007063]|uniref:restriction endonuclease subunit S n=1 Tax=Streptomyces sp. NPDC007063 TaxID=3364772 RepID=UPI00368EB836